MMTKIVNILVLLMLFSFLSEQGFAQPNEDVLNGTVSYITGANIYAKFKNTRGIENGDTLYLNVNNNLIPALLVNHKSTISCLCSSISGNKLTVGDEIIALLKKTETKTNIEQHPEVSTDREVNENAVNESLKIEEEKKTKQNIKGRISLSSYSNTSNSSSGSSHRFRYTFSMQADNISDSKLSAETYLSFSHKLDEWSVVQDNLFNALKVYSLAINYEPRPNTDLWIGRKINPRIANLGAIDGVQFQKKWKNFYTGFAVGARPDYNDYSFNPELLEYGAYIGHNSKVKNGFAQSSLAFFEQRNSGNIDRRFVYFQHSNTLAKNLSFFSSFELDLYKLENDEPTSTVSLTSLYLSLRYRFSRKLSLFGSYDNRKNVIYYETFRSYIDETLQQASRQGFRARITFRPHKFLNLGINAGTRNRAGDPRRTNSLRTYATYTKLPGLNAALTLSANLMQTSYLDGQVYGARLSKDWFNSKFHTTLNYRWVKFDYVTTLSELNQHIGEIDLAYRFNKKLYLSVNFESTFQENINYNRMYLHLRKRF